MDMQRSTLSRVEATIRSSYRQLFAIDEPEITMPQSQIELFAKQALRKHMIVAVTLNNQPVSIIGHFSHTLSEGTLLLRDQNGKVDHIVPLASCTFIQRLA
ncbi:hypothetical protein [Lacticaseibacillus hulanensis]|uniref:hypothetical protein n=1 Tax=Lacticaseibacillus hulanensis TaxID=2493111 RepID=UPI000FDBC501|nr:hypothetical protein [Lacticaseibacillus hulanensis]